MAKVNTCERWEPTWAGLVMLYCDPGACSYLRSQVPYSRSQVPFFPMSISVGQFNFFKKIKNKNVRDEHDNLTNMRKYQISPILIRISTAWKWRKEKCHPLMEMNLLSGKPALRFISKFTIFAKIWKFRPRRINFLSLEKR